MIWVRQHYSLNAGIKSELETHRRKISSLSEKLDAFQHKFHSIEHVDKPNFMAKNSSKMELQKPPSKNSTSGFKSPQSFTEGNDVSSKSNKSNFDNSKSYPNRKLGFYILPFVALQTAGDFRSQIFQTEIEQDTGFSSGWRIGVESPHFFIESEFSYSRNKLKGSVVIPMLPPSFNPIKADGETEGIGVLLNAGSRFSLSDRISFLVGAGFGVVKQEIGFDIASTLLEEEDTLFTYQLFSESNYDLSDRFRLGLRYRWMKVGEMNDFSSRDLHLAELSMGYVFDSF